MGQRIVEGVPNAQVKNFCRLQKALGATKCTPTDNGDKTSDVLLEFPDVETHDDLVKRVNS